jgi:NitT/TauT family transport system substrate-binding protein
MLPKWAIALKQQTNHQGGRMKTIKSIIGALGLVLPLAVSGSHASAEDTLKLVIGQINNWENQAPTLGQDAGIFKKHGLVLENTGTQGAGETIQAVISGSADIGAGVGAAGAMRAFSKGAPVRILAPAFTGTGDLFWYVKADSKIQSLKDATPENTIAYSTNGSSSNNIVVAFVQELGAKAKPTATGGPPATLTAVMSGQVDIGWAAPPFGLQEIKEGKIRIVAKGSDVPSLRGQTVRTLIVNANSLKTKHDAIMRFMDAYREAVDWMYSDPKAVEMYSKKINRPVDMLKESMDKFQPKETMQTDKFADLDGAIADAVKLKFLEKPLTKEQIAELLQIPPRKK